MKTNYKNLIMRIDNEYFDRDGEIIESSDKWKGVALDISKIKAKKFSDVKLEFWNIDSMLRADNGEEAYMQAYSETDFFAYQFHKEAGTFPRMFRFEDFNIDIFIKNLFRHYEVPESSYMKVSYNDEDGISVTSFAIRFAKDIFLFMDGPESGIIYYNAKYEKDTDSMLYNILSLLKNVKKPKISKNKIYIVFRTSHGFDKMGFDVKKINVNLEENYNDDFPEMSEKIIEGLNSKNKTNLVILSGEPGTGKTTYIRYLTSRLKKNIIFISPDMVDSITDPAFIPFLMKNNDSVLIIEDAEPALEKRNQGGRSSAVSNVLNLTDGLLSDCLKISIVATFNTGSRNLDDALLRKGRLLMNYKFDKLNIEKSIKLLKKLGHEEIEVKDSMTLADIYFYGSENNSPEHKPVSMGFKR